MCEKRSDFIDPVNLLDPQIFPYGSVKICADQQRYSRMHAYHIHREFHGSTDIDTDHQRLYGFTKVLMDPQRFSGIRKDFQGPEKISGNP